jgi:hypothetical protein
MACLAAVLLEIPEPLWPRGSLDWGCTFVLSAVGGIESSGGILEDTIDFMTGIERVVKCTKEDAERAKCGA